MKRAEKDRMGLLLQLGLFASLAWSATNDCARDPNGFKALGKVYSLALENPQAALGEIVHGKTSPARRLQIALGLATSNPALLTENLDRFQLNPVQRQRVASAVLRSKSSSEYKARFLTNDLPRFHLEKDALLSFYIELAHDVGFGATSDEPQLWKSYFRNANGTLDSKRLLKVYQSVLTLSPSVKAVPVLMESLPTCSLTSEDKFRLLQSKEAIYDKGLIPLLPALNLRPQHFVKLLLAFARNGNHNSEAIIKVAADSKLSDSARLELFRLMPHPKYFGMLRPPEKAAGPILIEAYRSKPEEVAEYFKYQKYIRFSNKRFNYEIGKLALAASEKPADEDWTQFMAQAPLTSSQREDLMRLAVEHYDMDLLNVARLKKKTDQVRFLVDKARVLFDWPHEDSAEKLGELLKGYSEKQKTEVLEAAAKAGFGDKLVRLVREQGLSRASTLAVLTADLKARANRLPRWQAVIAQMNAPEREALARKMIEAHPTTWTLASITGLHLSNKAVLDLTVEAIQRSYEPQSPSAVLTFVPIRKLDDRYRIAKALVASHPDEATLFAVKNAMRLPKAQAEKLDRVAFSRDPLTALKAAGYNVSEDTSLSTLKKYLVDYGQKRPGAIPKEWIDTLWDRVQKRQTGLEILQLLHESVDYETQRPVPKDSLEVLARAMGMSADDIKKAQLSNARLGQFYELALDIRRDLGAEPFHGVAIEPALYKKDAFVGALQRLRDALHLRGNNPRAWREVTEALHLRGGLKVATIDDFNKRAEALIVKSVQEAFGDRKVKLNYSELTELQRSWGDLEPVYTLVARYRGRPEWRKETGALAEIFEASLQNRFEAYKFEGNPNDEHDIAQAAIQLAPLKTPEQQEAWRQIRSRVNYFDPDQARARPEAERLADAKDVIKTNLLPHLKLTAPDPQGPENAQKVMRALETSADVKDAFQTLKAAHASLNEADFNHLLLSGAIHVLRHDDNTAAIRKAASALTIWGQELNLTPQVKDDLRDISNHLRPPSEGAKASIVFTTTFYDPKTLLTIGDLVKCASCQNYRSGSHIDALPGYVVDAHTQGLASFNLTASSFGKPSDFELVHSALQAGRPIKTHYNGARRTVTFEFDLNHQTHKIISSPLDQAYLRHVVKLGDADGTPGLYFERAYQNPTDAIDLMKKQVKAVAAEMVAVLGAKTDRKMTIAASRNPAGAYSDNVGGTQVGDYVIDPAGKADDNQ